MSSNPHRQIEKNGEGGTSYSGDPEESAVFDCAYEGCEPKAAMTFGSNDSHINNDLFLFNPQAESSKPKQELPAFLDLSNPFEASASRVMH